MEPASLRLINASRWKVSQSAEGTTYSATGVFPPSTESLKDTFGPFAFACVSDDGRTVFAARDHFGLEPFFYCFRPPFFIFGSSLPDVLRELKPPPSLDLNRVLPECFRADPTDLNFTTETFYPGIHRVEPGTTVSLKDGKLQTNVFWSPHSSKSPIRCAGDREYLEAFSHLLHEAIRHSVAGHTRIGAECSGGLDSTAILGGCRRLGISPTLFSHVAPAGSEEEDDTALIRKLLLPMGWEDVHWLDASGFEMGEVAERCAAFFAGPAPYLFFMLANPVHRAVRRANSTVLLSGFGGDECATGHAIARAYFPEQLSKFRLRRAWKEMRGYEGNRASHSATLLRMARLAHPSLYRLLHRRSEWSARPYYKSVRDFECDLLTGHALRMRVEYSAILARTYGFRYAYPFLYPPLVSFCLALPADQKRRGGRGRFLVRELLGKEFGADMADKPKKGGGIMPATLHACKERVRRGDFAPQIARSAYARHLQRTEDPRDELKGTLAILMLEHYQKQHGATRGLS